MTGKTRNARQAHPFFGAPGMQILQRFADSRFLRHLDRLPHPVPAVLHRPQSTPTIHNTHILQLGNGLSRPPPSVSVCPSWSTLRTPCCSYTAISVVDGVFHRGVCSATTNPGFHLFRSYFTRHIMCLRYAPIALVRLQRLFCL